MEILISSFTQGAVWAVMATGIYITFRLLNQADLSAEGTFTLGAAIGAAMISGGWHPILATLAAALGGLLAGLAAGLINTKMKIPALITGILMQTGLYSINLRVMGGRPNIALLGQDLVYTPFEQILKQRLPETVSTTVIKNLAVSLVSLIVLAIIIFLLVAFLNTETGLALRATGDNRRMSQANGISTDRMVTLGYMLGNALIAMAGAMVAQKDGFADIGMGIGQIVTGLSAIVLAEIMIPNLSIGKRLASIILGSFIYRLIIDLILNQNLIDIQPSDLRLFQAIILGLVLFIPELRSGINRRRIRREHGGA